MKCCLICLRDQGGFNSGLTLLHSVMSSLGKDKLNPMTVKIWDTDRVVHMFLDMRIKTGRGCGTAETILRKIESVMWGCATCVAFSVGIASVNMVDRNSSLKYRDKSPPCPS